MFSVVLEPAQRFADDLERFDQHDVLVSQDCDKSGAVDHMLVLARVNGSPVSIFGDCGRKLCQYGGETGPLAACAFEAIRGAGEPD